MFEQRNTFSKGGPWFRAIQEDCNWQKFSSKKKAIGFLEKVDHGLEQVRLLKFEAAAREQEARSVKRQIEKEFFNHD